MSASVMDKTIAERKRLFRELVAVREGEETPQTTNGLRHSREYVSRVVENLAETGDVQTAVELIEANHGLTSTREGLAAISIAADILEDSQLKKHFIDAEVVEGLLVFHFDKKMGQNTRPIEEALKDYGDVDLLAAPGDEIFEEVNAEDYIFAVTLSEDVSESIDCVDEDEALEEGEEEEDDFPLDDDDDEEDEEDDEDEDDDVDESYGYAVEPFLIDDEKIDEALEAAGLDEEGVDQLFDLCYFGEHDEVNEAKRKPPKMKLKKKAAIAAKKTGGVGPQAIRNRMLRAMAQKGFLVHGKYKKAGNKKLINAWKKFKAKGRAAALKSLRNYAGDSEMMRAAKTTAAKESVLIQDKLPELSETMQNLYLESVLDDLGLLEGDENDYAVTPFEMSEYHEKLASDMFSEDEVNELFSQCFESEEDDADLDSYLSEEELAEKRKMPAKLKKMKLTKKARLAKKNQGGSAEFIRTRMLRAMAQKGFLNHGKYKKAGNKSLIRKWKKFKDKGRAAVVAATNKTLKAGSQLAKQAKKAQAAEK